MIYKYKQGFTLVELIIVISIIAVLSSLAFMALQGETAQARDSKRDSDLRTFENSIATSNSKNKKIYYEVDPTGNTDRDGTADQGARESFQTNNGALIPIRGAYLVPIENGVFDSDVLPTATRDPKGSPYLAAFLSNSEYLLIGAKENPDTKTPTAYIRGSFKEGANLDVLLSDIDNATTTIPVSNPRRFVAGDVIAIDNEQMTVVTFNTTTNPRTLTVTRASNATVANVHSKSAKIKLVTSATRANSLVCLGGIEIAGGADTTVAAAWTAASDIMEGSASVGIVCDNDAGEGAIVDGGALLPYRVITE